MPVYPVSSRNFDLLVDNEMVAIEFWAEWCSPCKAFSKTFTKVSEEFPQITFAKINIENDPSISSSFHVRSIPHLVIMKDQVVIYSDSGAVPESTLMELMHQAIDADVSDIKKKLEGGE